MNENVAFSADQALNVLVQGNKSFIKEVGSMDANRGDTAKPLKLISGAQSPICSILSCSDSRVPPEIIFNQGIGD